MSGSGTGRWVLHLDMDAFFASVEQLTRPTVRDRPVLVGGLGPRAVVAGASYEARVFGARSAMPMGQARRLCRHAVVLPPRFALYQALSEQVMGVLAAAAPVLEPVSLDEAFLEPPALAGAAVADVARFAADLRAAVRAATGLPASVGAGSGKQLAKIASELAKPDGLRVVAPHEEQAVLAPLPVRALWGVGPVAAEGLRRLGVHTVGELAAMDLRELTGLLGAAIGTELHRLARGVDDRPVAPRGAAKQVSAETTFDVDLTAMSAVHDAVSRMTAAAHRRLVASGRAARTVTVKVRSADFTTSSRSETAAVASTDLAALTAVARRLADAAVPEGGVRLIGVSLAGLTDGESTLVFEPALFELPTFESGVQHDRTVPAEADDVPGTRYDPAASSPAPRPPATDPAPAVPAPPPPSRPDVGAGRAPDVTRADPAPTDPEPGTALLGSSGLVVPDVMPPDPHPPVVPTAASAAPRALLGGDAPPAERTWRAGDDVRHPEHGHGWVQGAGHGRVTVRFETRSTGRGRARTFAADNPDLTRADPLGSLR